MKPLARKNNLIAEEVLGDWVVYDDNNKKAHSLNATVAWIWRHSDGATDLDEMAMRFDREFGSSGSLDIVLSGIKQLEAANLLMPTPQDAALAALGTGPTMSRRSIVATGSALAPIIASILVPTAAAAKSGSGHKKHKHEKGSQDD